MFIPEKIVPTLDAVVDVVDLALCGGCDGGIIVGGEFGLNVGIGVGINIVFEEELEEPTVGFLDGWELGVGEVIPI